MPPIAKFMSFFPVLHTAKPFHTSASSKAASRQSSTKSSPVNSISFCPASHPATSFGAVTSSKNASLSATCPKDASEQGRYQYLALLRDVAPQHHELCSELLHTSLSEASYPLQDVLPKRNGFVHTVIEAYNNHRALVIRPDDVWLAILTQFCFFVNGNAEALRDTFVAHQGKKELIITAGGNRYSMDPARMARQMTNLMQEHIVDPSLREWIMPNFTTTTTLDKSISAIVMMGTMKEYFSYGFCLSCGIPQVTIEGEKSDWEDILHRLERLKKYSIQTIAWYHLLRPIISRIVAAYDNPSSPDNLEFWSKVAHMSGGGSGPTWLSGWITAFCIFDEKGGWQGNELTGDQNISATEANEASRLTPKEFASAYTRTMTPSPYLQLPYLQLDGFPYPMVDSGNVPCGYTYVDVKLDDNGVKFDTMFVAGLTGLQICAADDGTRNTVRPLSAWWYFIKQEKTEATRSGRWGMW